MLGFRELANGGNVGPQSPKWQPEVLNFASCGYEPLVGTGPAASLSWAGYFLWTDNSRQYLFFRMFAYDGRSALSSLSQMVGTAGEPTSI